MRILILFIFVTLTACSSKTDTCESTSECDVNQVCNAGTCQVASEGTCLGDPDCPGGFKCVESACVQISTEPDAGDSGGGTDTEVDASFTDVPDDGVPPTVSMFDPADGATDVPLDQVITITLSEPPMPTTVNFQSVLLRDASNANVPASVTHEPGTTVITVTPEAPLRAATGYTIVVTAFVRDMAFNQIEETTGRFATIYEEPAEVKILAERFAPVVYQSIAASGVPGPNFDLPTRIDFDGDSRSSNNQARATEPAIRPKAAIYYHVVQSRTHHFITYMLYYPTRTIGENQFEHDFTGVTFVIEKATGAFKVSEGVKVQLSGNDTIIGYKPSDSDVQEKQQEQNLWNFNPSAFDGERYPLFIPAGQHEACNWTESGPTIPVICQHAANQFTGDPAASVVMRNGAAQTYAEAVADGNGQLTMEYELVNLMSELWPTRSSVGADAVWQSQSVYTPLGDMRPGSTEVGPILSLPTKLSSGNPDSYGKSPFRWFKTPGESNSGQFLLDPAWSFNARFSFQEQFSLEYCLNPIFGIDRTSELECQD